MLSHTRLVLRPSRFQLLAVLTAALAASWAALYLAIQLSGFEVGADCLAADAGSVTGRCAGVEGFRQLGGFNVVRLVGIIGFAPFTVGTILGAPLVAREIEHQTAGLAWALDGDRGRWLMSRVLPLGLAILGILIGPLTAAEFLIRVAQPGTDPGASFQYYGSHGILLLTRGLLIFSIAVFIGAIIGRTLAALLVATLAAALVFFVLGVAQPRWVAAELVSSQPMTGVHDGSQFVDLRYRASSGELLTFDQLVARSPEMPYSLAFSEWQTNNFDVVELRIAGSRYPEVAAREAAVSLGGAVVFLVGSALILNRRRPY